MNCSSCKHEFPDISEFIDSRKMNSGDLIVCNMCGQVYILDNEKSPMVVSETSEAALWLLQPFAMGVVHKIRKEITERIILN